MSIMKLQDFITPAEPKNGIRTPSTLSKAEELRCMIQKLKNSKTTHAEDVSRQQLTDANIVASTESEDCLDHIFQLNMVYFLNQWLQEAAKSGDDEAVNEQVINAYLQSLENIPLCQGKLNSSGIIVTIKELFGHKLFQIKQRLEGFFERWIDRSFDGCAPQMAVGKERCRVELSCDENNEAGEANFLRLDDIDEGKGYVRYGYGAPAASTLNEKEKPPADDNMDTEMSGGEGVWYESSEPNLMEFELRQNFMEGLHDLSSTSNGLEEYEDPALEMEELDQQVGVEWEVVDYTGRACNTFPELTSGELLSSERSGKGNFLLDLNIYPGSNGLDCELSLPPSNPLNPYAPVAASSSNGPSELQFLPLNLECELSSRNSAVLQDSEEKENYGEINLNLEIVPPFMSTPSSSHWAPNLDLNLKSGPMVNGGNEKGSLVRAFMAESRNLLGEERKNLKRKEPDSGWDPLAFDYSRLRLKL
ncbi:uncharacterized protein LOC110032205 [Phalaenopsis equestris]|uniref:uncharacterized protein LOC110032205 n=1 Tax=Phalaenopsis equestris TaxID=78828 RepID=UPI0009E49D89|nr:uncharacterized protein LOC110032205 [Phalaenopsis equestris]XP_020591417.1 uncharacterized protein LOC110032205 [Phalaenopsis equestris]